MANKFFLKQEQIKNKMVWLEPEQSRHLTVVLRKRRGDLIRMFDGKGTEYEVRLEQASPSRVKGVVVNEERKEGFSQIRVRLFQALSKGKKMDQIVKISSEMGVETIYPFRSSRTVSLSYKKIDHWRKIALSESQISGLSCPCKIFEPEDFKEILKDFTKADLNILFWEEEKENSLKQILKQSKKISSVNIFIGPEGGFSRQEVNEARKKGILICHIGSRILRTETASLAVISAVLYELGEWEK